MIDGHVAVTAYTLEQQTSYIREGIGILQSGIHHKALTGVVAVCGQFLGLIIKIVIAEGIELAAQIAEPVLMPFRIFGKYQIIAFSHLVDQLEALVGRGLAVIIQTDHNIAAHMMETGHQRAMLTKVTAEIHKYDRRIILAQSANHIRHIIRTAVIDQDDLMIVFIRTDGYCFC